MTMFESCGNEWGECRKLGDHWCSKLEGHAGPCLCECGATIENDEE